MTWSKCCQCGNRDNIRLLRGGASAYSDDNSSRGGYVRFSDTRVSDEDNLQHMSTH